MQGTVTERAERQSLFVLSNLEFQNANRDLIYQKDSLERLNACLQEIQRTKQHQRLFVWEPEVSEKVRESNNSLLLIFSLFMLLLLAKYLK